ncbi:MAG: mevalonate kinase [ANME-2 cluster archaeon]|nr:mevalonate kinase [ANME-2 cluster archaeon]
MTTCSAPGKIYFFGEHAVVYGEQATACAVDIRTQVTVRPDVEHSINSSLGITGLDMTKHPYVTRCIREMEPFISDGVRIDISSELPVGSGLGSSAAVTIATLFALSLQFDTGHTLDEIAVMGHDIERIVQGVASPTDTYVSTMGGVITIPARKGLALPACPIVIGYTGSFSSTRELVGNVGILKEKFPAIVEPVISTIGKLSMYGETAIERQDYHELGRLMDINHGLLDTLGVGSSELSKLVWASRHAGAWGAKTTGAGGGGCMVAITDQPDEVAEAIEIAGGQAMITRATPYGVKIE